jgi:hypothetical protein
MTLLSKTPGLSRIDAVDRLAERTHKGQACWAGGGPDGAQCRDCIFFNHIKTRSNRKGGIFDRPPLTGHCAKYTQLMHFRGPAFPGTAMACRHFGWRP